MEPSHPSQPAIRPTGLLGARLGPDLLGILALAVAAMFIVAGGAYLYGAVGWIDPWIYTSYISSYGSLLDRFGRTYYSTRVAAIWPQGIAYKVFGSEAYAIIRWVVLLACGGGVASFLRQRTGRWISYAGGLAVIFSAPLLFALEDDYTQEVAIAYVLLALPFLAARRPMLALVGGIFISLAVNAHEGIVYLAIPLLAACLVDSLMRTTVRRTLVGSAYVVLGFFTAQGLLSLIMGLKYGWVRSNYFFQETTIDFYQQLSNGLASKWSVPWNNDYTQVMTMAIVVGVWLLGAAIVLAIRRREDMASILAIGRREGMAGILAIGRREGMASIIAAAVASAVLIAMVLYSHFVKQTGFVGLPYTLVYASTLSVVVIWLALGATTTGRPSRWLAVTAITATLIISMLLPAWLAAGPIWDGLWWLSITIAFGCLIVSAMPWRHAPTALAIGAMVTAGFIVPLGPLTTTGNARASFAGVSLAGGDAGARNADGAAVHSLAIQFEDYVTSRVPPSVPLLIYYPWSPALISIQSTFLWGPTCADCTSSSSAFPHYPRPLIEYFQRIGNKALVIMAPSRAEALQARTAAGRAPLPFSALTPLTALRSGTRVLWVTVNFVPGTPGAPNA